MTPSKVLVVSVILVSDLISCKKFISPMNLLRALYSEEVAFSADLASPQSLGLRYRACVTKL